jgi:tetraacyldisaccharide 4'-kinase
VSDFFSADDLGKIKHRKIFGFSGIARNDDFQRTVKDLGFAVTGFLEFSDHHRYTAGDLENIWRTAEKTGAQGLITTEKDHVRFTAKEAFPMDMVVVGVKVSFGDGKQDFISFLKDRLQP